MSKNNKSLIEISLNFVYDPVLVI